MAQTAAEIILLTVLAIFLANVSAAATNSTRLKRQASDDWCLCVNYYNCGDDDKVITDGTGTIDQRFGGAQRRSEPCPGVLVCCGLPDGWSPDGSEGPPNTRPVDPQPDNPSGNSGNDPDDRVPPSSGGKTTPGIDWQEPNNPSQGTGGISVPQRPGGLSGCGVKRVLPFGTLEDRITGPNGNPRSTFFGEFPWMVALLVKDNSGKDTFACGASLITPSAVLTGAHCVHDKLPAHVRTIAGEWDSRTEEEPIKVQNRVVTRIIKHENFNPDNLVNDIAILFVETPFQLNEAVDTICLTKETFNAAHCEVTGWGLNRFDEKGRYQPTLKKVSVPLIDRNTCQTKLRTTRVGNYFKLHESFLCAGGGKDADACTGDGGGPLVCANFNGDQQRYAQVGIVSWGIECGVGNPGVYTDVSKFYDWITRHVQL